MRAFFSAWKTVSQLENKPDNPAPEEMNAHKFKWDFAENSSSRDKDILSMDPNISHMFPIAGLIEGMDLPLTNSKRVHETGVSRSVRDAYCSFIHDIWRTLWAPNGGSEISKQGCQVAILVANFAKIGDFQNSVATKRFSQ